jgi:hypothetical protein
MSLNISPSPLGAWAFTAYPPGSTTDCFYASLPVTLPIFLQHKESIYESL